MRLAGVKEVTFFTRGGKLRALLPRGALLPFRTRCAAAIKPRFPDILYGAFIDTRALGGIFVFASALRRISRLFGETPVRRLRELLSFTAARMDSALIFLRVTVPQILLTAAAFVLAAWVFVYISRVVSLLGFRVCADGASVSVRHGLITLYEHFLVPDTAVLYCDTFSTLLSRRAPIYLHGTMLLPCVGRGKLAGALGTLCGYELPQEPIKTRRGFMGYIAAPLSAGALLAAGALAAPTFPVNIPGTLMRFGALYCLFLAGLFLAYVKRAGLAANDRFAVFTERRGLRLYTAVFPWEAVVRFTRSGRPKLIFRD